MSRFAWACCRTPDVNRSEADKSGRNSLPVGGSTLCGTLRTSRIWNQSCGTGSFPVRRSAGEGSGSVNRIQIDMTAAQTRSAFQYPFPTGRCSGTSAANALFCTVNAASHLALPHSDLEALFAEDRRAPDLLPRFPTNEQAEVLISEQIPQGLILEILVQAKEGPIRDLDDPRIRIDPDAAEWNTRNFAMSQDRFRAHFMRG
jgi:hypothetical protein